MKRVVYIQVCDYYAYMKSKRWRDFKDKVFKAKGRVCSVCGTTDGIINVHHLHYRTLGRERLQDVRVLCHNCHKNIDFQKKKGK